MSAMVIIFAGSPDKNNEWIRDAAKSDDHACLARSRLQIATYSKILSAIDIGICRESQRQCADHQVCCLSLLQDVELQTHVPTCHHCLELCCVSARHTGLMDRLYWMSQHPWLTLGNIVVVAACSDYVRASLFVDRARKEAGCSLG